MIIGVGCDIIEIERISRAIERAAFVRRVFAAEEIAYCQSRGKQAEEAVLKALGTGLRGGELTEIVVTNDELGKPAVELRGYHKDLAERLGAARINISLSHGRDTAVAYVVMEDGK